MTITLEWKDRKEGEEWLDAGSVTKIRVTTETPTFGRTVHVTATIHQRFRATIQGTVTRMGANSFDVLVSDELGPFPARMEIAAESQSDDPNERPRSLGDAQSVWVFTPFACRTAIAGWGLAFLIGILATKWIQELPGLSYKQEATLLAGTGIGGYAWALLKSQWPKRYRAYDLRHSSLALAAAIVVVAACRLFTVTATNRTTAAVELRPPWPFTSAEVKEKELLRLPAWGAPRDVVRESLRDPDDVCFLGTEPGRPRDGKASEDECTYESEKPKARSRWYDVPNVDLMVRRDAALRCAILKDSHHNGDPKSAIEYDGTELQKLLASPAPDPCCTKERIDAGGSCTARRPVPVKEAPYVVSWTGEKVITASNLDARLAIVNRSPEKVVVELHTPQMSERISVPQCPDPTGNQCEPTELSVPKDQLGIGLALSLHQSLEGAPNSAGQPFGVLHCTIASASGEIQITDVTTGGLGRIAAYGKKSWSSWDAEAPAHTPIVAFCGVPPSANAGGTDDADVAYDVRFVEQFLPWQRWSLGLPWSGKAHFAVLRGEERFGTLDCSWPPSVSSRLSAVRLSGLDATTLVMKRKSEEGHASSWQRDGAPSPKPWALQCLDAGELNEKKLPLFANGLPLQWSATKAAFVPVPTSQRTCWVKDDGKPPELPAHPSGYSCDDKDESWQESTLADDWVEQKGCRRKAIFVCKPRGHQP